MRVACIGNMNNNLFALTRYLRDSGVEAELLLFTDELQQFHPSADTYRSNYLDFTKQIRWGNMPSTFYSTKRTEIESVLRNFDFVIGCGASPAYLNRVQKQIDLFIPYGSDLYKMPFVDLKNASVRKIHKLMAFASNQRAGIQNALYLSLDATNEDFEKVVSSLKIRGQRLKVPCPFLYAPQYQDQEFSDYCETSLFAKKFKQIRNQHEFVLFHHSRQEWISSPNKWTFKSNDKLIKGFADFVSSSASTKACLVMLEYGSDVLASKKLIQELGIEKNVVWFPQMPRKDIMVGIHNSDVGAGEFNMSWFSYGTIYEFMAMGKPVMHHRDDELYQGLYPSLYPMINAYTVDEIASNLHDCAARPEYYKAIGKAGRNWFLEYAVRRPLDTYMDIIRGSAGACRVDRHIHAMAGAG